MNILDFLKGLFSKTPQYGTGLIDAGPADSRNIPLDLVQVPVPIPDSYTTDISMLGVENQGNKPSCVGYALTKLAEYYIYKDTGKVVKLSARALYAAAKVEDGIPNAQGTYALVAAKILIKRGVPTDEQYHEDTTMDYPSYIALRDYGTNNAKVSTGYAFVDVSYEAVCQAIYQNGMITVGMYIDANWYKGIIGRVLKAIGGHQTNWLGYDKTNGETVVGLNSWGIGWIGKIAGYLAPELKPGFYIAKWDDVRTAIINMIALVPIPKKILDEVNETPYRFMTTMRFGTTSPEVKKLQERLGVVPASGYFGNYTLERVRQYQKDHNIYPIDGIVGPGTRMILNGESVVPPKSYMTLWIAAIKQMEGAKPSRNNPGNLRFIGQKYAVNDGGFCKFDTYEHGYQALETLLRNAATGKSKVYSPSMTLTQFYHKYAPASDGNDPVQYAKFVATKLGVPVSTKIADLV